MNSYFQATSATHCVTVWPGDESGFFDVVSVETDDMGDVQGPVRHRVTAGEAATIIATEVGVGVGQTIAMIEASIRVWRADHDSRGREPIR